MLSVAQKYFKNVAIKFSNLIFKQKLAGSKYLITEISSFATKYLYHIERVLYTITLKILATFTVTTNK